MDCPACGGDNRDGAHFCRHCGAPLPELVVEAQVPAADAGPLKAGEAVPALSEGEVKARGEAGAELLPVEGGTDETAATQLAEPVPTPTSPDLLAEERSMEAEGGQSAEAPALDRALEEVPAPVEPAIPAEAGAEAEAAPLVPLEPGTVVGGRYLLTQVLDVQPSQILYSARDLCRCMQCGFEGNSADDAFCAQCGASRDHKPSVRLMQVPAEGSELPAGEAVAGRLSDRDLHFAVLMEAVAEKAPSAARGNLRLVIGQRSDVGRTRELNEDGLLVLSLVPTFGSSAQPLLSLLVVADGMGGHEGGEVASKLALQVVTERVVSSILLPELSGGAAPVEELTQHLTNAVAAANDAVYLERHKRETDMGTTLTAALVRDDELVLAHVGDCRAYRWKADGLEQLTTDHSLIASMVAAGRAEPEEVYTHPQRSVIYRSIGDRARVDVDTRVLTLAAGDRLVLCSDGLWEMVRSDGIADVLMQEADPQAACDLLVQRANVAGGLDNISVIVAQVATA